MANKFDRIVSRIMTGDEARERATAMGLAPALVEWLGKEFEKFNQYLEEWLSDNPKASREEKEERGVGSNGRAALGQSWEDGMERLAEAMGVEDPQNALCEPEKYPEVEKVWDAFFEE